MPFTKAHTHYNRTRLGRRTVGSLREEPTIQFLARRARQARARDFMATPDEMAAHDAYMAMRNDRDLSNRGRLSAELDADFG